MCVCKVAQTVCVTALLSRRHFRINALQVCQRGIQTSIFSVPKPVLALRETQTGHRSEGGKKSWLSGVFERDLSRFIHKTFKNECAFPFPTTNEG